MGDKNISSARAILSAVVAIGAVWYFFGGGLEKHAASTMGDIEVQVAKDSITQYEMTERSGSSIDKCVHAGLVAAAFLQAKDETNYRKWKSLESSDCEAAGIPQ